MYQFAQSNTSKRDYERNSVKTFETTSNNSVSSTTQYNDKKDSIKYKRNGDDLNNKKEATLSLLNAHGINAAEIMATTYGYNNDGVLTIIRSGNTIYLAIIDNKNNRVGLMDYYEWVPDFKKLTKGGTFEINIEILNDTRDADKDLGYWNGSTHILPVSAAFEYKGNH